MNILDIVKNLNQFSDEHTIYAVKPWKLDSNAVVMEEPEGDLIPVAIKNTGMEYFLEIFTAKEIIEDITNDKKYGTVEEKTKRLIEYAINDC